MAGASNPTAFNAGIALGTALGSLTVEHTGIAYTAFPGVLLICTGTLLCYWLMRPERIRLSRISFRS
jgi:predicted MFS family arabinose efflux permease